jgi:hypothetical protein
MQITRNNKVKWITACCLLLLFTFIQVVKLGHTHAVSHQTVHDQLLSTSVQEAPASTILHCTICDYQLSKEALLTFAEEAYSPVLLFAFAVTEIGQKIPYSVFSAFDTRGSPVLV